MRLRIAAGSWELAGSLARRHLLGDVRIDGDGAELGAVTVLDSGGALGLDVAEGDGVRRRDGELNPVLGEAGGLDGARGELDLESLLDNGDGDLACGAADGAGVGNGTGTEDGAADGAGVGNGLGRIAVGGKDKADEWS